DADASVKRRGRAAGLENAAHDHRGLVSEDVQFDRRSEAEMVIASEGGRNDDGVVFEEIEIDRLNLRVAVVAEMNVAQKIDRQNADRNLLRLHDAVDIDHRREADAPPPERLQLQ